MTGVVALALDASSPPTLTAALFVDSGVVGAHVGIVHSEPDGTRLFLLHQGWHLQTHNHDIATYQQFTRSTVLRWVKPGLEIDEMTDLRTQAALVARRVAEKKIPYAFKRRGAEIDGDGNLQLKQSLGLSCSTFVSVVFLAAGIKLLDESSWEQRSPEREKEDRQAQEKLIALMKSDATTSEQAKAIEAELGCVRIRAEEVAAASGLADRPVLFLVVEPHGVALLKLLNAAPGLDAKPDERSELSSEEASTLIPDAHTATHEAPTAAQD